MDNLLRQKGPDETWQLLSAGVRESILPLFQEMPKSKYEMPHDTKEAFDQQKRARANLVAIESFALSRLHKLFLVWNRNVHNLKATRLLKSHVRRDRRRLQNKTVNELHEAWISRNFSLAWRMSRKLAGTGAGPGRIYYYTPH